MLCEKKSRPADITYGTFLDQDLSLNNTNSMSSTSTLECVYIVKFAFIVGICRFICNKAEASEENSANILSESLMILSLILSLLVAA